MITKGSIYYFPTHADASAYAERIGAPTDRILHYGLGWAIQWHKSGPYVGTDSRPHTGCRWCKVEQSAQSS